MEREEWISKIILSCISLRQLNELRKPVGFASGCLIDYFNKRIVLTVAHATGNNKNWGIEIKSKEKIGTQLYNIGAMMFLTHGNISTAKIKDVDFSYATVPNDLQPFYQEINETGKIINQVPRDILQINFDIEPSMDKKYGFCGQSRFSTNNWLLYSQSNLILDLKFVGLEEDYYKFKLPAKHPGHDYFKGTSGAPILDMDGNAIALVCHGDEKEDIIYGVALKKYKSALDIEVGNINK
jgi:hypothetical protein